MIFVCHVKHRNANNMESSSNSQTSDGDEIGENMSMNLEYIDKMKKNGIKNQSNLTLYPATHPYAICIIIEIHNNANIRGTSMTNSLALQTPVLSMTYTHR